MCEEVEHQKPSTEVKSTKSQLKKTKNSGILKYDSINEGEQLTLEDLAPDGGWGWMILLGMIIVTITMFSTAPCIPIIFEDLLEASGQAASAVTILTSVWTLSWSISALLTNVLLKKYPMRQLGISGALLFSMTHILSSVVTHVYQLTIMFFLQGIGIGIMSTICQANFNSYFVKKRVTLNSAAQIIISVGGIMYPILIGILMETYGFRGTAAIIGALNLHSVFGMMLMHPVQWHLRSPQEVHEERRRLLQEKLVKTEHSSGDKFDNNEMKDQYIIADGEELVHEKTRCRSLGDLEKNPEYESLTTKILKEKIVSTPILLPGMHLQCIQNLSSTIINTRNPQLPETYKQPKIQDPKRNQEIGINEENQTIKMLLDLLDFSILKDRNFVIMCLGVSCSLTSDVIFTSLLPLAMFNQNYTTMDVSMTVTVSFMAEFVTKICLTIFGIFFHVRPKAIFFFAMISMNAAKLGYFFFDDTLTGIMISFAIIGVIRVLLFVPQPLVVVENYPVEKYAACFAMFALINGLMLTTVNPIFGIIRDFTSNFTICQMLLITLNSAFIIPWGIELGTYYRKKDKQDQEF